MNRLPAAAVEGATVDVTPGLAATATVTVTNRRSTPCTFSVAVTGLEAGWVQAPEVLGPLAPGAGADVPVTVTLPAGHPPSSLTAVVVVTPRHAGPGDPARSTPTGPASPARPGAAVGDDEPSGPATADLQVVVGTAAALAVRLEPADIRGRRRGRFAVVLRNRQDRTLPVQLTGHAPQRGVSVRFTPPAPLLQPGRELRVDGRIHARPQVVGAERRHPFAVQVHGRGRPLTVEGSFTSRPLLPQRAAKVTAIVAVLVLWAAVAAVGISALSSHLHHSATVQAATANPAASGGSGGATGGSGSGGAGSGGSGSGRSGGSGSGGSGSGSAQEASATSTVQVAGRVGGPAPGGVSVTLAPTSLVDPSTLGASAPPGGAVTTAALRSTLSVPGKVFGIAAAATLQPALAASAAPHLATTSAPDGTFVFTGVPAPGTYLLTFAKAGYTVRKYIVQAAAPGHNVTLNTSLSPGTGALSGSVTGPGGPLGGVSITVAGGSLTMTTRTPSTGSGIGTWSLNGLSTPGTYLVTASDPGFGTQTTTVTLGPSASRRGVTLQLRPGVGSIGGTVESARTGQPVGGVTVTATDGATTVEATTSTVDPVGHYLLPNLQIPSTWTVTVSGSGFTPQTRSVPLDGNTTVNASLTPAGADVVGVVSAAGGAGLPNVGLTLANQKNTFKTLSESAAPAGGFDFGQVPPGRYILTAGAYGYTTESSQVDVSAGQTQTVDLTLPYVGKPDNSTAVVQGNVVNLFTAAPVAGVAIDIDGKPTGAVTSAQGAFSVSGVAPGRHTVTALGNALGYGNVTVTVTVAVGATVVAPPIELPKLDTITGTVTSAATGALVANPSITLLQGGTPVGAPVKTSSTATGQYTVTGVAAGSYVLEVSATGYVTSKVALTLGADQDVTKNVALDTGPSYSVETFADTATGFTAISGVCIAVSNLTDPSQPPITKTSTGSTPVQFEGLVSGDDYRATFSQPAPGTTCASNTSPVATAPPDSFVGTPDNTAVYSAFLSPAFEGLTIDLLYPVVTAGSGSSAVTTDCPVTSPTSGSSGPVTGSVCETVSAAALPTVTITGTVGATINPNGTSGPPQLATVEATPPGPGSNSWTFSQKTVSKFVAADVTLTVTDPTGPFEGLSPSTPLKLQLTPTTVTELVTPDPVPIGGTISPASGVSVAVTPSTIAPSSTTGAANALSSPDTITATESSTGTLAWADPLTGRGGYAQPGVYTVTFSASGYDSVTDTVTVSLCPVGVCPTVTANATLAHQATLVVQPTIPSSVSSLPAPTISLTYDGSAISGQPAVTGTSATFTDALSPAKAQAAASAGKTGYVLTVAGPGLATSTTSITAGDISSAPLVSGTPTVTETPSLTAEGYLTGSAVGIIVPVTSGTTAPTGATEPLAGATVTATLTASSTCPTTGAGAYAATLTATTDTTGDFTIVGDPSAAPANGGLCVGGSYTVTVAATGFTSNSATFTAAAGSNSPGALDPIDLSAKQITQVIDVTGLAGGVNVTVTASSLVGPTVTQSATVAKHTTSVSFTFTLDPTPYSFTVQAANYETVTVGPLPYTPGFTPQTQTVQLPTEVNTVSGTVSLADGTSTVAIGNLPLTLVPNAGNGATPVGTTTTASDGTYSFSNIPNGSYVIEVGDGYSVSPTPTFSTDYPNPVVENFTVSATAPTVNVTITSTVPGATDVENAKATLTPESSATVSNTCTSGKTSSTLLVVGLGATQTVSINTAKPAGFTAQFASVTPDIYSLDVSGVGMPTQTPTTVVVCPDGTTSPPSVSFAVQQGDVSGTVTVDMGTSGLSLPSTVTLAATPSSGSALTTTCTPPSSSSGSTTYSCGPLYLALGTSYTVTASAAGYTSTPASQTVDLSASSATATFSPTLTPTPRTVVVTLDAGGSPAAGLSGAQVSLTQGSSTTIGPVTPTVTTSSGTTTYTATFSSVPPSSTIYDISVTPAESGASAESAAGSIQVGIGTGSVGATAALSTGAVTGTVTLKKAATSTSPITVTVSAGGVQCASVSATSGTVSYSCTLPVGTYTLDFTASDGTSGSVSSVAVTNGATTSSTDVTLT